MAGYVIHIAVAKEWLRKHKEKEEKEEEFIKGTVDPDRTDDKSKTHYGSSSDQANLISFLEKNEVNNSYKRGYFLHLLVDKLFYNYYFNIKNIKNPADYIYDDYDKLNKELIKKYHVVLPEELKKYGVIKEGETSILKENIIDEMISDISDLDLEEVIEELKVKKYFFMKGRKII